MKDKSFITAPELAEMLDMSAALAYKVIRQLNGELAAKGYLTFPGCVPRKYLSEHYYGLSEGGPVIES